MGTAVSGRRRGGRRGGPAPDLDQVAAEALGFAALTEAQREAIDAVRDGRDALVVLPTGAGKSAIYQLGTSVRGGAAVVVAPLLALQHDQRLAIEASGLGGAEAIDASTTEARRAATVQRLGGDDVTFVFSTPETLVGGDLVDRLAAADVRLLVVDEAHCLLTWGSSFRPAYASLAHVASRLGRPPVLALTASAGPADREEITTRLGLRDPLVLVGGVRRDNLSIVVRSLATHTDVLAAVAGEVRGAEGAVVVFVADRREAEHLAAALDEPGRPALAYHGGLARAVRHDLDERITSGTDLVVVTTNALSLGIDPPAVRLVAHVGRPPTVDAYYQEIGRAGRDGRPASCVLLDAAIGGGGRRVREAAQVTLEADDVRHVLDAVRAGASSRAAVRAATSLGEGVVAAAVSELQALGVLDPTSRGLRPTGSDVDPTALAERCRRRSLVAGARRAGMDQLLADRGCRWRFLEGYFGAAVGEPCGTCDRCRAGDPAAAAPGGAAGTVEHPEFGHGTVVAVQDGTLSVSFDDAGLRILDAEVVREGGWLRASRQLGRRAVASTARPGRRRPSPDA